jgi:hypothetical protein
VNHCTMSEHGLVIVIRTKQTMQPGGCKLAHSVRETPANKGFEHLLPVANRNVRGGWRHRAAS